MKKRSDLHKQESFHCTETMPETMRVEKERDYTPTWLMICMVNPSMMEGRKIVRMINRIIEEKTPQNMKAWI